MAKVKINLILTSNKENYEKTLLGTYRGNKLYFLDDSVHVTITLGDEVEMKRVSNEYEIMLKFKDNEIKEGIYNLKKLKFYLPIDIKTNKMYIDSGHLKIDYEISSESVEMDKFLLEIKYEVIE